jgi:hypothetical protein
MNKTRHRMTKHHYSDIFGWSYKYRDHLIFAGDWGWWDIHTNEVRNEEGRLESYDTIIVEKLQESRAVIDGLIEAKEA